MGILSKIQSQSEFVRKTILWLAIFILGAVMLFFWVRNFQKKLQEFPKTNFKQQLQLPGKNDFPQINAPEINDENLKKIEEMLKASSTDATSSSPADSTSTPALN